MLRTIVVDDSASMRELLRMLLEDVDATGDFRVVGTAADGRAGQELAAQLQPDVIISDVRMPVLDGLEAAPGYRSAAPEAVLVLTSSESASTLAAEATAAGAHLFLDKGGWGAADYVGMILDTVHRRGGAPGDVNARATSGPSAGA